MLVVSSTYSVNPGLHSHLPIFHPLPFRCPLLRSGTTHSPGLHEPWLYSCLQLPSLQAMIPRLSLQLSCRDLVFIFSIDLSVIEFVSDVLYELAKHVVSFSALYIVGKNELKKERQTIISSYLSCITLNCHHPYSLSVTEGQPHIPMYEIPSTDVLTESWKRTT